MVAGTLSVTAGTCSVICYISEDGSRELGWEVELSYNFLYFLQ